MDTAFLALELVFPALVVARFAADAPGRARGRNLWTEVRDGLRQPAMAAHGAGLLLLWAGAALAVAEGRVAGAVTASGLAGLALVAGGELLLGWAMVALRSWRLTPALDADHQLCTAGPYRLVRHPMYLAIALIGVGTALWARTPLLALAAVLLVAGGDARARREEQALLAAFGDRYRAYMARVRRLVPGLY